MANKEHLAIVKMGSEAIAEWIEKNPNRILDLCGANLRRVNLAHSSLNSANLQDVNLEWADLRWADLKGVNLTRANLTRADFHKADLSTANLSQANFTMTNLEDADLSNSILNNAIFGFTRLISTTLFNSKGLDTIEHKNISIVDKETFVKFETLPKNFKKHLTITKNAVAIQSGYEFERRIESIYRKLGKTVKRDIYLGGFQFDILISEKNERNEVVKTVIECKAYKGQVGSKIVKDFAFVTNTLILAGEINKSLIISKSGFTHSARDAATLLNVELLTFSDLQQMLNQ